MLFAVILAGGLSKRLWPLTKRIPKQFLQLGRRSLVQEAVSRIEPLVAPDNIYIVTLHEFRHLALEQLLQIPDKNLILEPRPRNTAPPIGLAAVILEKVNPQGIMIVSPSDILVKDSKQFRAILKAASKTASRGEYLVILGIRPEFPSTEYGYIHYGEPFGQGDKVKVHRVLEFKEKPNEQLAKEFLRKGNHLWDGGMLVCSINTILSEFKKCIPALYGRLMEIRSHLDKPNLESVIKKVYQEQRSISIDHGISEKSRNLLVIPADVGWRDIGSCPTLLSSIKKTDKDGSL